MDKARAKAFLGSMVDYINGGSIAMMCSIGHRTGLFDSMAGEPAMTSEALAERAELNERYVREWLWAMASAGIVDYDAETESFLLPEEHRMLVTRAGGSLNLAASLQSISLLAQVEDDVVEAFQTGAGVPYSKYPNFQDFMAEQSGAKFDAALLSQMIPNIPGAPEALTEGARLADLGCGRGHALMLLAEAFPNSSFHGFDFSSEAMLSAQSAADERGLTNLTFTECDAAQFTADEPFDFITTFDAIHDQAQPATVLRNIHDALRDGGWYLCVEPKAESTLAENMLDPMAPFTYTMSTMHCMSVSIAGGGEGLGTAWGTQRVIEHLEAAGFSNIETRDAPQDRTNTHFVATRAAAMA